MRVSITSTGTAELAQQFEHSGIAAPARAYVVTKHYGQLLVTQVQANASGRPGPRAPTGDYRRSWGVKFGMDGIGRVFADVGTNKPQGRRLEMGFQGVDSLGRSYDQPPYEHVRPAVDLIGPRYRWALAGAVIVP